jgi:predicted permease
MARFLRFWRRLPFLFRRRRFDRDLEDEMRFHLEMKAQQNRSEGMSAEEARYAARRRFGNVTLLRERSWEAWGWGAAERFAKDVKLAARMLRKNPGFTAVAVLSLALGIGANTAIFSLINALVLRTLPVDQPGRLVLLSTLNPNGQKELLSVAMFEEIQRRQQVFSGLFGWRANAMANLEANGVAYAGCRDDATGEYFATLAVKPLLGRLFTPEDAAAGPPTVAVLDYRCWRRRFNGDPAVVGKFIRHEGKPLTIIGVTPESFGGLVADVACDLTVPLAFSTEQRRRREALSLIVAGRLKDGVSLEQARAHLEALWPAVQAAAVPEGRQGSARQEFFARRLVVDSAATGISYLRERFTRPLAVLMGVVALILLIACVNLASLMLSRAAGRQREMAIRVALGASGWRLVCQHLAESLLLAAAGAALGLWLAEWGTRFIARLIWTGYVPLRMNPAPDAQVLAFTAGIAIVTAVLFGIAPAWRATRADPGSVLQRSARMSGGTGRLGKALVAVQVALSLVLLIGAALFLRTIHNLRTVDVGFRRDGILLVQLFPRAGGHTGLDRTVYYDELADKVAALPGVRSVSYSNLAPIVPYEFKESVEVKSGAVAPVNAVVDILAPRFLETLGMRLLAGRDFNWHDDANAPRVALVSESLARRLFPLGDAVGQHLRVGAAREHQDIGIVGVVNSASLWILRSREPMAVYTPLGQVTRGIHPQMVIRAAVEPVSVAAPVRRTIESLGREYPLRIQTLRDRENWALMQERLIGILSSFFSGLALLLACVGLYGLMSYSVSRRIGEMGIRMALGAAPRTVLHLIIREAVTLVLAGILIGLPVAFAASRLVSGLLFGLSPADPLSIVASVTVLTAVALLAGYLPARRAARTDPMEALRCE